MLHRLLGSGKKIIVDTPVWQSVILRMGFFIMLFTCSPIPSPEASHIRLPRLCDGHRNLLTNNKDAPCLAVNFASSGFAKWAWLARKGFVVVCDSLSSLLCHSLGAGDYNLPIAQFQNIYGWIVRLKNKSNRPRIQPLLHESKGMLP